ncbi:uncharacterized protein MEPE_04710 [Melanopsichium pennsylvanicum]|uniref:Zn(2)-C6 fungal-type domain-containing protein n=2 Tax=Melanopsichium pennsylvanicum TaxID=63383 RepID=A0AAJ4XQB5_9BASI|nr:putative protein [Melanopsichium pennsylvanicum 4]SNX86001.1 uncharacterized protein MEPE_04710 [Melanopsichium pennsylvanicum]
MSDHQNPDQPLQELATAAQLDEELEQQQQKELEQRQKLLQQQHAELEARRQAEELVAQAQTQASTSAPSTTAIMQPVQPVFPQASAASTSGQLSASSLGDVDAVIAAAVNASKQHAEQERLHEEQQLAAHAQQQPPVPSENGQHAAANEMDVVPTTPPHQNQQEQVETAGGAQVSPSAQPRIQPQSSIDPSAAAANANNAKAQHDTDAGDVSMRSADDPDASMMSESASPVKQDTADESLSMTATPKPKKERAKPKPRSKSATKITRFRKITSCLQCRDKKQKCDRVKPVCGNCRENPTDDPCHYVDDRKRPGSDDEDTAADSSICSPLVVRKRKEPEDSFTTTGSRVFKRADFPRGNDRRQALMVQTRRDMVEKLEQVGRDRSRDFTTRVNAARAAAIADVLFESAITLPTADEISALLYTYKTQVEPFVNVVVIDINIARIQSFLRWWHSKPTTMPVDPPLVPLLLVILALTLQVRRNSPEFEGHNLRNFLPIPGVDCSDERTLLSVAGHCIDALQIACPSAWSSAFQAPIDLTKASLLRGIWHLNELNLQFAGTCFALTTRLAHAAGLHRDPEHWSGIRTEEAQARRNLWWNIVFFEVAHAHRIGQPPCLTHEGFDTQYPDDYGALCAMYERAGLADPDPSRIILPPGATALVPRTPSQINFDYHWARFRIYHIFLRQSQQLFRFGISSPPDPNLNDEYAKWRENLPEKLKLHFERRAKGSVRPSSELLDQVASHSFENRIYDPEMTEEFQDYQQGYNLEFMYHQCMITLHRPYIDEQGAWRPPESVQKSLEVCLQSAGALISTADDVLACMPANCMYNQCAYFAFNAGLILAIHCKLDPSSQLHRPQIQKALDLLDTLSGMARLTNVAEQAGRYSSTLKQMLHGIGGDIAGLAATKPLSSTAAASGAERQDGEANGEAAPAAAAGEDKGESSQGAILGALDPSLGGEEDKHDAGRTDVDGGPDRIPAFVLPFVGLPTDPNHLGPRTGNSFWSESFLDRPLVGVPIAYPVGFGQSMLSNADQHNGNSWPTAQQHQAAANVHAPADANAGFSESQAHAHDTNMASESAAATTTSAAADNNGDGQTSADAYDLYELLGAREPGTDMPDRPMSFSQHYNHHNPNKGDQGPSASYRTYVQNSLARTYDQQQQQHAQGKAGEGGDKGAGNSMSAEPMPSESALNAVAAAAAAAAEAEAEAEGKEGLDPNAQGNNLAGMWYAWENFSQMLNNRQ